MRRLQAPPGAQRRRGLSRGLEFFLMSLLQHKHELYVYVHVWGRLAAGGFGGCVGCNWLGLGPICASLEKFRHRAAPEASLYSYGSPPLAGRVEASRAIGRKLTRTRLSSEQNRALLDCMALW